MNSKTNSPILSLRNVRKYFGGIKAVDGVSFDVAPNCITGLIGPNGAGKTTLFNLISGFYKPDEGEIFFQGKRIDGLSLHQTFHKGLCRTFQISRELKLMTVLENIMLVPPGQQGEKLLRTWLFPKAVRKQEGELREKALSSLESVNLLHLKDEYAGNLSGGQKRLLELARTMMASPTMIMFDEPGAGVNPSERRTLASRIREIVETWGITVLLIGHEMELVMDVCSPIIVLDRGKVLTEGTPAEVRNDKRVLEVYLGGTTA
ncbi:MAG: ABC transporter ATP-binding protein [Spirochaetaceae bacterium]|nr:MAG: ABC transporter ATP-binding protein [Spirochaetaceae bacterium]